MWILGRADERPHFPEILRRHSIGAVRAGARRKYDKKACPGKHSNFLPGPGANGSVAGGRTSAESGAEVRREAEARIDEAGRETGGRFEL